MTAHRYHTPGPDQFVTGKRPATDFDRQQRYGALQPMEASEVRWDRVTIALRIGMIAGTVAVIAHSFGAFS